MMSPYMKSVPVKHKIKINGIDEPSTLILKALEKLYGNENELTYL